MAHRSFTDTAGYTRVAWFSGGVSSAIATYLARNEVDRIVYIEVADAHPDTERFVSECERLFGKPIERIRSTKYKNVDDVIHSRQYINGVGGAPCTTFLKKKVREEWEADNFTQPLVYYWGYDLEEQNRADRLQQNMGEFEHRFPLIEAGLTKSDCHGMIADLGIKRPAMYDLGYPNNNCIGCVKGGKGYWNKIRQDFPDVFALRAKREREIGHSCIKGTFLDELDPQAGRNKPIVASCSLTCMMMEVDNAQAVQG